MKSPRLLRTLATIFLIVGSVSLFGNIILSVFLDDRPVPLFQLPRTELALIIATVSFVIMIASLVGSVILGKAELEVGSISPGVEVTVRYNPITREVALERVK